MSQVARDIIFFLVTYTILYGLGLFIAWLWLPIRLLALITIVIGIWDVTGRGITWNLGSLLGVIIPILIVIYPSLAKSFSLKFNPLSPFRFIWERLEEKRYMRLRAAHAQEEKDRFEREREMAERIERISRMQAEEAERQRQFEREKAEREAREKQEQANRQRKQKSGHEDQGSNKREDTSTRTNKEQPKDPYEVLGVTRDMSKAEIRKAYLKLMGQYAPDHVSHLSEEFQKMAHEKCVAFNLAWERIKEVVRR